MTVVMCEKKDYTRQSGTGIKSRFHAICLLFLLSCICAGFFCPRAAMAADGPKSAVEGIIAAVDNADADAFEKNMDITSVARHVFTELETMGKMPEYSGQMPPILSLLINQNAFTNPVTQEILLSEVRKFVRYGVGSGAFAGKKVENYKGESMMAPLFSLISMGKKEITRIETPVKTEDGRHVVPFAVVDHENGNTYYVRAIVTQEGNSWKITDIQNIRFLIQQILLESAATEA